VFSFRIGNNVIKLPMIEYMNLLTYIKLKELELSTGTTWSTEVTNTFTNMIFPIDRLTEIYELLLFYKDMRHDYDIFKEFKTKLNKIMNEKNQLKTTRIFNIEQFNEYLAGNIPNTFLKFFEMMEEFYPDNVNIIDNFDQNKIMKEEVRKINNLYQPKNPRELFNIIALQDTEYTKLNNGLHDMLKNHFIDKYPRVVQAIDAITDRVVILELYLYNYKRMLVETVKMDTFITYFVNDLFKMYLTGSAFKDNFFDPVMQMFQQYFFKAELSYQNSDTLITRIKDKMQQVVLGSTHTCEVDLTNIYSELTIRDTYNMLGYYETEDDIQIEDNWNIQIINSDTGIHNFSSNIDSEYDNR
ncbi:MAG: hypothetical protein DRG78_08375, partial [Epsilonproteobacteria bacterium]